MASSAPADNDDEGEWLRYVTYLQASLVNEGTEAFLARQRVWFENNRSRLAAKFDEIVMSDGGTPDPLNNAYLAYQDRTGYDSVFAHQIFSPILERSLTAAGQLHVSLRQPVVLANAPSVDPSPSGLPSTAQHILFIGQGTSSFCNYWSKIFAATFSAIGKLPEAERSDEALIRAVRDAPIFAPAIQLLLRYARSGSLLGFGELKQDARLGAYQIELCHSMETFIVGHELGHFLLHERYPATNGVPPGKTLKEMELLCDSMGFAICRAVGKAHGDESSRHLIGPLLLFYALRLCDDVSHMLLDQLPRASETHPTNQERIHELLSHAAKVGPSGDLSMSLQEALGYVCVLGSQAKLALFRAGVCREPSYDEMVKRLRPER